MKIHLHFALLATLSIIIALLLWLPQFDQLPRGLNRDEAALGYNAYSLLQTGKDEWGKTWPISIASFGDQKLPGYIYTLIPFVAGLGLESSTVRLPSLLAGLVVIVAMGLIALELARQWRFASGSRLLLSTLVMIFCAISPWQMHFSRVAYETHLAMAFFVAGLACLLYAFQAESNPATKNKPQASNISKTKWQRLLLIKAGLLFALTLLTYHSYQIFLPLFLLALLGIFGLKILRMDRIGLSVALLTGAVAVGLIFGGGIMRANQVKSIGTSPFGQQALLLSAVEYRQASQLPLGLNKLLFNRLTEGLTKISQNYLTTISGSFFFVHGSGHGDHNPGNGNNLHLFLAPLILLGLLAMWTYRKSQGAQLVLAWLALGLLPSSMTTTPLSEVRLATVFPVLELLGAIGLVYLSDFLSRWSSSRQRLSWLAKSARIALWLLVAIIATFSTIRMFVFYTVIAPRSSPNNQAYHQLAKAIAKYQQTGKAVLTQSPSSSPYIWYLVVNQIDTALAQKALEHYPPTSEGFIHVRKFENVYFETINWDDLAQRVNTEPYILILKPTEFSDLQRLDPHFQFLEAIYDQGGQLLYEIWQYQN